MMKGKLLDVIRNLLKEDEPVTAKQLSAVLKMSERSIKNYISEINYFEPGLIDGSRKGYRINKERGKAALLGQNIRIPETPGERIGFIILKLLAKDGEEVREMDLYDIGEKLFVSYETVKKDMSRVRKKLKEFELYINTDGSRITVEGKERNKRRLLSSVLYEEFSRNVLSLNVVQKAFPDYDLEVLREIILKQCKKFRYFVNDYAMLNLIMDVVISMDRIRKKRTFITHIPEKRIFGTREKELSESIIRQIEEIYDIVYNKLEREELTGILVSHFMKVDFGSLNQGGLIETVGAECYEVVCRLLDYLKENYLIDVENEDFTIKFTLHISNLLSRLKNHYSARNPLAEHIKNTCPLIFDCAVSLADKLHELTGYRVGEDEIAYIALHIGGNLTTGGKGRDQLKCILLFPQYYDFSERIMERIKEEFGERLAIMAVVTDLWEIEGLEIPDLVISTLPAEEAGTQEWVLVSPFLNDRDIAGIKEKIEKVKMTKRKQHLKKLLIQIASEELFCKNPEVKDQKEALSFMVNCMEQAEYVEPGFIDQVLEREEHSSTSFGHIAVPHSLKMDAHKTGMFVMLSNRPIPWGEHMVRIILLFSVNREDRAVFHEVFDNLVVLLLETIHADRILKCDSYEEFIDTIVECFQ
ncbi:BglG family transcription antiterminator [Lacrimispora indolis]|uniref:BglG family transcription antiterminator n=1 Tax=Lacrimispora indolis TaxID=69825 RepID=UPI0009FEE95E|nr:MULTISPECIES: BglG family transcription antiterminator [Lachnospiraceae]MBE7722465.1 BglG family transcription antiterminator [Lacrimispora celerecrescens]